MQMKGHKLDIKYCTMKQNFCLLLACGHHYVSRDIKGALSTETHNKSWCYFIFIVLNVYLNYWPAFYFRERTIVCPIKKTSIILVTTIHVKIERNRQTNHEIVKHYIIHDALQCISGYDRCVANQGCVYKQGAGEGPDHKPNTHPY